MPDNLSPKEEVVSDDPYPSSEKSQLFKNKFYPNISNSLWNTWQWQYKNKIDSFYLLNRIFDLQKNEVEALNKLNLPLAITPYYASLMSGNRDPLRKTMIPSINEYIKSSCEEIDPLNEEHQSPVEGIVHRYPDRVLFLSSNLCSCNCRYCTRSRIVGHENKNLFERWNKGIAYIKEHSEIRDVLISGGDPLLFPTEILEKLLKEIRNIEHVEIIRIGTKIPIVLPQRINKELLSMLKKYHPLYMNIHVTHPNEITVESKHALNSLANIGIPLGSQTVLLKDINDSTEIIKKLMHELLKVRVKPYYLYQCDPIVGSKHFRTKVETGQNIIKELRGFTSGMSIPNFVIDAPRGGGKIPVNPNYIIEQNNEKITMKNYEGKEFTYYN